mgnify:CR=1 FL=1
MKKRNKIIAGLLGVLSVGSLVACSQIKTPTETRVVNPTPQHVLRANSNTQVEQEEYRFENLIKSSCSELGISKNIEVPKASDYKDKDSFDVGGFHYSRTTFESGTTVYANVTAETKAAEILVYQDMNMEGEEMASSITVGSINYTFKGSDLVNCKVLVTNRLPYSISSMTSLETLILTDENVRLNVDLPSSLKNIVFVGRHTTLTDKYSTSSTFDLSKVSKNIKLCAAGDSVYYYAPLVESISSQSGYNEDSISNKLYVIDNPTNYTVDQEYIKHFGGMIYLKNDTKWTPVAAEVNAESAVIGKTIIPNEEIQYGVYTGSSTLKVGTIYALDSSTWTGMYAEKLYLGEIGSNLSWSYIYKISKEIHLPMTEGSIDARYPNDARYPLSNDLKVYYPESCATNYQAVITALGDDKVVSTSNEDSKFIPTLTVDYKGIKKSTTTIEEGSYEKLLKEAKSEYENAQRDSISKEKVDQVIAYIDAIGEVNKDSKESIIKAKDAYEALTATQQKSVTNTEKLKEAIKKYNEAIKDDKDLEPIKQLGTKSEVIENATNLIDKIKENKTLTVVTSIIGAVTGLLLIYLLYKLIRKFVRWVRR